MKTISGKSRAGFQNSDHINLHPKRKLPYDFYRRACRAGNLFFLCNDIACLYDDRAHGRFAGYESHAAPVRIALSDCHQCHPLSRAAALLGGIIALGPRLGSLLLSLAPIFGAAIAWVFFGETLTLLQITGIVLALAGIAWVVLSHEESPNTPRGHTSRGVFFGVMGGLGQAVGLVLSKQGMVGDFSPFRANAIRMLAAVIFIWIWTALEGKTGATIKALREKPQAIYLIALGAFLGPLLGVSASLLAVQHAEIGVASTLMALPPVIILPISYFAYKEKVGWQAILGTILAIAGVAILFLA